MTRREESYLNTSSYTRQRGAEFYPDQKTSTASILPSPMMKALVGALVLALQASAPSFRFETDGFWLNLHHCLYVLERVETKMPDVTRVAVAGAPADETEGLKGLGTADRQTWREAVSFYAQRLSRQEQGHVRRRSSVRLQPYAVVRILLLVIIGLHMLDHVQYIAQALRRS